MKKSLLLNGRILLVSALLMFTACEIGLGEAVDTEPPSVSISLPEADAIVRDNFIMSGNWSDDLAIGNIEVTLRDVNDKSIIYGPYSTKTNGSGSSGTWTCALNPRQLGIPDGTYEATVKAKDDAEHTTTANKTFTLDNTAPLIVLESPSTVDIDNPNGYGRVFTVSGRAADDSDVDSIDFIFYDKDGNEIHRVNKKGVGTQLEVTVAEWGDEVYNKIYGTDVEAGTKAYYVGLIAYDGARKVPAEEGDKGNAVEYFYLWDELEESIGEVKTSVGYKILNGRSTVDEVVQKKWKEALEKCKTTKATFSLNPVNNPYFEVSRFEGFAPGTVNLDKTEYEFTNKNTLVLNLYRGRDNKAIKVDTIGVYLRECDVNGNIIEDAEPVVLLPPYMKKVESEGGVKFDVNKDTSGNEVIGKTEHNNLVSILGTSYSATFSINNEIYTGLEFNKYYVIDVVAYDNNNTGIYNDNLYGFKMVTTATPPVINVSAPANGDNIPKSNAYVVKGFAKTSEDKIIIKAYNEEATGMPFATSEGNNPTVRVGSYNKENTGFDFEFTVNTSSKVISGDELPKIVIEATSGSGLVTVKEVKIDPELPVIGDCSIAPTVEIETAGNKTSYVNGTITVKQALSDNQMIKSAEYSLDNGATWTSKGATNMLSFDVDTTQYPDKAAKIIKIRVTDTAGNVNEGDIVLNIDQSTDAPEIKLSNADKTITDISKISSTANLFGSVTNNQLLGTITDDDGIAEIKIRYTKDNPASASAVWVEENVDIKVNTTSHNLIYKLPATQGDYYFKIIVKDNKNQTSYSEAVLDRLALAVDNGAPQLAITTKSDAYQAANSSFSLAGTVDDYAAKVTVYEVVNNADGFTTLNKLGQATVNSSNGAWSYSVSTNTDSKELQVEASDKYGQSVKREFKYKIDAEAPTLAITTLAGENYPDDALAGKIERYASMLSLYTVKGSVNDTGSSGLEDFVYYIVSPVEPAKTSKDGKHFYNISDLTIGTKTYKWQKATISTNTSGQSTWIANIDLSDGTLYTDGQDYDIYLAVRDEAANTSIIEDNSTTNKVKLWIDSTNPSIFEISHTSDASNNLTITAAAYDGQSGLPENSAKAVKLILNKNVSSLVPETDTETKTVVVDGNSLEYTVYTFKVPAANLSDGENTYNVTAYDKAGNTYTYGKEGVINNSAPEITLINNLANNARSGDYYFTKETVVIPYEVSATGNYVGGFTYVQKRNGLAGSSTAVSGGKYYKSEEDMSAEVEATEQVDKRIYKGEITFVVDENVNQTAKFEQIFTAENAYGAVSEKSFKYIVDLDNPTISDVSFDKEIKAGGYYDATKTLKISGAAADVGSNPALQSGVNKVEYRYKIGAGDFTDWEETTGITSWNFKLNPEVEGTYTIELRATDNVGNEAVYSTPIILIADLNEPVIAITSVKEGNAGSDDERTSLKSYYKDKIKITGSIDDTYLESMSIRVKKDSVWADKTFDEPVSSTSTTWVYTLPNAAGTYEIEITAKDRAGKETKETYKTKIDTVAPVLDKTNTKINNDIEVDDVINNWFTSGIISFDGQFIETETGISSLEYFIKKAGDENFPAVATGTITTLPGEDEGYETFGQSINGFIDSVGDTHNEIKFVVQDRALNENTYTYTIKMDTKAPVLSNLEYKLGDGAAVSITDKSKLINMSANKKFVLSGKCVDTASGIKSFKINLNDSVTKTITPAPNGNWSMELPASELAGLANGADIDLSPEIVVEDNAGNVNDSTVLSLRIDTTKPEFSNSTYLPTVTLADVEYVNGKVKISTSVNDSNGIASIAIYDGETLINKDSYTNKLNVKYSYTVDTKGFDDNSSKELTLKAVDVVGNVQTETINLNVKQSTDNPIMTLDSPFSNENVTADDIRPGHNLYTTAGTLSGTITDDDGISKISVFVNESDDAAYTDDLSLSKPKTYQFNYKLSDLGITTAGVHKVQIKVEDTNPDGYESAAKDNTAVINIGVDNENPTISLTPSISDSQKKNNVYYTNKAFTIRATIKDDYYLKSLTATAGTTEDTVSTSTTGAQNITYSIAKAASSQSVTNKFTVTDRFNKETESSITYVFDLDKPGITLAASKPIRTNDTGLAADSGVYYYDLNKNIIISGTANDSTNPDTASGLTSVMYGIAKGHVATWPSTAADKKLDWTAATGTANWTVKIDSETIKTEDAGSYTVFIKAVDLAGNEKQLSAIKIVADAVDPVINATPSVNEYTNAATPIEVTVTESNFETISLSVSKNGTTDTDTEAVTLSGPTGGKWSFTIPLIEGDWKFVLTAKDKAKKTTVKTITTTIDKTAPKLDTANTKFNSTLTTSNIGTTWLTSETLKVDGRYTEAGTGIDTLKYSIKKAGSDTWEAEKIIVTSDKGNYETFTQSIDGFADSVGTAHNTIKFVATDKAGNPETKEFTVMMDKVAPAITDLTYQIGNKPAVSITDISKLINISGDYKFKLSGKYSDTASGIKDIKLQLNSSTVKTAVKNNENGTWSVELTTAELSALTTTKTKDVNLSPKIIATDIAGNTNSENILSMKIDVTKPALPSVTYSPTVTQSDVVYVNGKIKVTGSVSDANGIASVALYKGAAVLDTKSFTDTQNADYSFTVDTKNLSDNTSTELTVKAVDIVGNESTKNVSLNVKQSTDNPVITLDAPFVNSNATAIQTNNNLFKTSDSISFTVKDDDGIASIKVYVGGVEKKSYTESSASVIKEVKLTDLGITTAGEYKVQIKVEDTNPDGYASAAKDNTAVINIGVDNENPTISLIPSISDSQKKNNVYYTNKAFTIRATIKDDYYLKSLTATAGTTEDTVSTSTTGAQNITYSIAKAASSQSVTNRFTVTDRFNKETESSITYVFDLDKPGITLAASKPIRTNDTGLAADSGVYYYDLNKNIIISGTANDSTNPDTASGLTSVMYGIAKGHVSSLTSSNKKLDWTAATGTANWTVKIDSETIKTEDAGSYTVFIKAVDLAGNEKQLSAIKIVADASNPVISSTTKVNEFTKEETQVSGSVTEDNLKDISLEVTGPSGATLPTLTKDISAKTWSYTIPETEGTWKFVLTATDKAGKTDKKEWNTIVDKTKPTYKITAPITEGAADVLKYFTDVNSPVEVKGTVTDNYIYGVYYKLSEDKENYTSSATGWTEATINGNLWSSKFYWTDYEKDKPYVLNVAAVDKAGNISEAHSKVVKLHPDSAKPVLTMTNAAAIVAKDTVTLSGTVTEANLKSFTYSATKKGYTAGATASTFAVTSLTKTTPATGNASDAAWKITLPKNAGDGIYVFTITATDIAGQKVEKTVEIKLDTGKPELSTASGKELKVNSNKYLDESPAWTNSSAVTVTGTYSDSGIGVEQGYYYINPKNGESAIVPTSETVATGTFGIKDDGSFSIISSGFNSGSNLFYIAVKDKAGNYSDFKKMTVKIDGVPPALKEGTLRINDENVKTITSNGTEDIVVKGTLTDADSGIKAVSLTVDGENYLPETTSPAPAAGSKERDFEIKIAKEKITASGTVYLRIEDVAGNITNKDIFQITFDDAAPEVTINYPTATDIISGKLTVLGSIRDDSGIDVDSVYYVIPTVNQQKGTETISASDWKKISLTGNLFASFNIEFTNASMKKADGSSLMYYATKKTGSAYDYATKTSDYSTTGNVTVPIYFKAKDILGNEKTYKTVCQIKLNADNNIPEVELTSHKDKSKTSGVVNLMGTASDNEQVASVKITKLEYTTAKIIDDSIDWKEIDDCSTEGLVTKGTVDEENKEIIICSGTNSWKASIDTSKITTDDAKDVTAIRVTVESFDNNGISSKEKRIIPYKKTPEDTGTTEPVCTARILVDKTIPYVYSTSIVGFDKNTTVNTTAEKTFEKAYSSGMYISKNNADKLYLKLVIKDDSSVTGFKFNCNEGTAITAVDNSDGKATPSATTFVHSGLDTDEYTVLLPIKIANAGHIYATLEMFDGQHTDVTTNYSFDIDNTPPVLYSDNGKALGASGATTSVRLMNDSNQILGGTYLVENSNGSFVFGDTVTEAGAGLQYLAFWYGRKPKGGTSVARAYNPIPKEEDDEDFTEHNEITIASTSRPESPEDGNIYINSDGLACMYVTATNVESDEDSGTSTITLETADNVDDNVRIGGLIMYDGAYRLITKVDTGKITFSPAATAFKRAADDTTSTVNAELIYAQVVDHQGIEVDDKYGNTENGDGDGMTEVLKVKGAECKWQATFDSQNIPDGPIEIFVTAIDNAGNISHGSVSTKIANNRPRVTRVMLATDLNGNGTFDFYNEKSDILNNLNKDDTTVSGTQFGEFVFYSTLKPSLDSSNKVGDGQSLVTLSGRTFRVKKDLLILPEFVGGNGKLVYGSKIGTDATPATTAISGTESLLNTATALKLNDRTGTNQLVNTLIQKKKDDATTADPNYGGLILAMDNTNSTIAALDDDTVKNIAVTFWDETSETTQGTDSLWAMINIPAYIDVKDTTKPTGTITPFWWNSKEDSSFVYDENGNPQGHIDLDAGTVSTKPGVAGKVYIDGTAFDDTRIGEIHVIRPDGTTDDKIIWWGLKTGSTTEYEWKYADGASIVSEAEPSQDGHTIKWRYEMDMSSYGVVTGKVVKTYVVDAQSNEMSLPETNTQTIKTALTPTYIMDFVPYIKSIYPASATSANRSRLGKFPVRAGEDMVIEGMNFTSSASATVYFWKSGVDMTDVANAASSKTVTVSSDGKITVAVPEYSRYVSVKVSGVETKNNTNVNGGYNIEAGYIAGAEGNGLTKANQNGTNFWTDDRYISVWKTGTTFKDSRNSKMGTIERLASTTTKYEATNARRGFADGTLYGYWGGEDNMMWDEILGKDSSNNGYSRQYTSTPDQSDGAFKSPPSQVDTCMINDVPFVTFLDDGWEGAKTFGKGLSIRRDGEKPTDSIFIEATANDLYRNQFQSIKIHGAYVGEKYHVYVVYYDAYTKCLKYAKALYKKDFNMNGSMEESYFTGKDTTGKYVIAGVDSTTSGVASGQYCDIKVTKTGIPVVVYYYKHSGDNGKLAIAKANDNNPGATGFKWTINEITSPTPAKDFGRYVSIEMDNEENLHITAQDVTNGVLYYGCFTSSGTAVVDWTKVDATDSVGRWTDIKLNKLKYGETNLTGLDCEPVITYMSTSKLGTKDAVKLAFVKDNVFDSVSDPSAFEATDQKLSLVISAREIDTTGKSTTLSEYAVGINSTEFAVDYYRGEGE